MCKSNDTQLGSLRKALLLQNIVFRSKNWCRLRSGTFHGVCMLARWREGIEPWVPSVAVDEQGAQQTADEVLSCFPDACGLMSPHYGKTHCRHTV